MLTFSSASSVVTSLSRPTRSQALTRIATGKVSPRLVAPGDRDQPLRVGQVGDVGAVGAVDGDAAAAGDVADDLVAVDRLAAGGQVGQQVADAHHLEPRRRARGLAMCGGGGEHVLAPSSPSLTAIGWGEIAP